MKFMTTGLHLGKTSNYVEIHNSEEISERINLHEELSNAIKNNDFNKTKELLEKGIYPTNDDLKIAIHTYSMSYNKKMNIIEILTKFGAKPSIQMCNFILIQTNDLNYSLIEYLVNNNLWIADDYGKSKAISDFNTYFYKRGNNKTTNLLANNGHFSFMYLLKNKFKRNFQI